MIDRVYIKGKAKEVLRKYYWLLFVVGLIMLFLSGEIFSFKFNMGNVGHDYQQSRLFMDNMQLTILGYGFTVRRLMGFFGIIAFLGFVISLIFRIFVANPLIVGCHNYFVKACDDKQSLDDLAVPFNKYYKNAIGTMLLRDLFIGLWSLLLVVPGIVKAYGYSFVPYLLEDAPNLAYSEVLRKSEEMTRGLKFELFVLDLSFLGWYLLNFITFNLATLFIKPYVQAASAQVYMQIRDNG